MTAVRVRFAPSPTGPLHIGGVRTALFNYLFAKNQGGKMILRIEDTDQNRYVDGAEAYIQESLAWLGITLDESPANPGAFGPYRQSERKAIYKEHVLQLIDKGHAYYAFDTSEALDEMREKLKAAQSPYQTYNAITRTQMSNSLTLSPEEVKAKLDDGAPYVVRMKIPVKEEIRFKDLVRGSIKVHASTLDDKILLKSDGMPTYHLANIVDDHLMQISHVIRGEEWLPSAPIHVLLYRFFGWEDTMPKFAHLPLILKPTGNGKLSKRDGDKHGYPVFPLPWKDVETGNTMLSFQTEGYLQQTMVNFLSLLGWNPGTEQELFSMEELINQFSIERIGKAGTKFDLQKAQWFNQHYIKEMSDEALATHLPSSLDESKKIKIAGMMKERIQLLGQLEAAAAFFFNRPTDFPEKAVRKAWKPESVQLLELFQKRIVEEETLTGENAHKIIEQLLQEQEMGWGKIMLPLRLALTGDSKGPDLMEVIEVMGAQEVSGRIDDAKTRLKNDA